MPLWDAGAVGLDQQVRGLEPDRPQAPGAAADRGLGAAEAPGKLEQPPAAILGVERVGQAHGDVLTRHPAAEHGGESTTCRGKDLEDAIGDEDLLALMNVAGEPDGSDRYLSRASAAR